MKKRSNEIRKEREEASKKLLELQRIEEEARKKEEQLLADVTSKINEICDEENIFCGVVLTTEDLLEIVRLAIAKNENITIPFRLYFNE